ncbi:hypothetical protein [Ornithinibacillus halophilus]|uniref:Uncharacterized protein n=1 Tax=Ornithinibacillus halophilus TaxID=930117 RepID=A0A1M5N2X5_9BACI|nr:hypothetical protein [Ornithinibacillus halophilus]SHG83891.1 hypothetical protein SAMN05216225_106912 [Ornithinibacillus halophilus]
MDLHTKIKKLTKSELVDLLMDLVEGDEDIQKKVEFKIFTPNDEIKASKQLIRKYINENKRRGFVSWRNVHASLQGAEMVLNKGRDKLVGGEEEVSIRLGLTVISMVTDMLQYTDDSGGEIDYMINRSIDLLRDASSMALLSTKHRVQEAMFQLILNEALHKRYDGWNNIRHDLLDVCTIYSARSNAREELEITLDKLLTQISSMTSHSSDYDQNVIKQLQLKIMERNGETEKAQHFINENIDNEDFREMAIEKELESGNYESALQICLDGETYDAHYPGLVKKWKHYRLQIYESTEDIEKQKEILREFVCDNEYESYAKLKDLYTMEEWENEVDTIFNLLEDQSDYLPHVYEYIAKAEERSDKILKYSEQFPSTIVELYPYLVDEYQGKVDEIFTKYILSEAEQASDRTKYRDVAKKLETFKDACGEARFDTMLHDLKETYHRKPAFMNELDKVE